MGVLAIARMHSSASCQSPWQVSRLLGTKGPRTQWLMLQFQSKRTRSIFQNQCRGLLYDFLAIDPLAITVPA